MIDVLVVGAGPVGIVTALQLTGMGVRTVIIDRSLTPTRFPKMDISNARTMELFETLGIAADVRRIGVAEHYSFDVIWTADWDRPPVAVWDLPSVETYRKAIVARNDGTQPSQPYQRLPRDLVLVRPDHFVAWRGNAPPTSPDDVLSVVTGLQRSGMSA